jgi:hypothetical protein
VQRVTKDRNEISEAFGADNSRGGHDRWDRLSACPDPERTSYGSFFAFADPDGNAWLVQEVTTRLPGRD